MTDSNYSINDPPDKTAPKLVAVIDIGATSLRMQIAELHEGGRIRNVEAFSQAISLGKDAFAYGRLQKSTIEDCVHVLKLYREKLDEYEIRAKDQIRVIATSGVKEASNRLAFLDRIFIACGFDIELIDDAELHRVTYLGVLPSIESHPEVFSKETVVCEVGGGTTEFLLLERTDVLYSQTLRMGALRLRRTLDSLDMAPSRANELLQAQILQSLNRLPETFFGNVHDAYIAMGSDIRFAANEIHGHELDDSLIRLETDEFESFVNEIIALTPDQVASKFHFSLPDAESLGPGLMTHLVIARQLKANNFFVLNVSLRDGLLQEMARGFSWTDSIQQQMVRSAVLTGQRYEFDQQHAEQVASLACQLFDQLRPLHHMNRRSRGILEIAALVHEIGLFVSPRSYHKHSLYLIRNSEFFGIGSHDVDLVALVARYHRRAVPQPNHEGYVELNRADRVVVSKLAAILRVAKALDVARKSRILQPVASIRGKHLLISTNQVADLSLEQLELKKVSKFFEAIFGQTVILQSSKHLS